MAHELAGTLQQAGRIQERCALKEPYVYVRSEYIDVAEGRISQTCHGTAVMQKFPDFVATFSHHLKALMRDGSQSTCMLFHPRIEMAGSRSTAPLNRSNSVLIVMSHRHVTPSWRFESYRLVPGCHTFLILHGIAETFGLDAELA